MVSDKLWEISKHNDYKKIQKMELALLELVFDGVDNEVLQIAATQYIDTIRSLDPKVVHSWLKYWDPNAILGEMGIILDSKPSYNVELVPLSEVRDIPIGHSLDALSGFTNFPSTNRDEMYRNY